MDFDDPYPTLRGSVLLDLLHWLPGVINSSPQHSLYSRLDFLTDTGFNAVDYQA